MHMNIMGMKCHLWLGPKLDTEDKESQGNAVGEDDVRGLSCSSNIS